MRDPYVCRHCLGVEVTERDKSVVMKIAWALDGGCIHYWRERAQHFEATAARQVSRQRI